MRHYQPESVAEVGSLYGWSTTWILRAIRENGQGKLHTFDLIDNVIRTVPNELSTGRWHFHHGNIRNKLDEIPSGIEYLFIDAEHTGRFAKWYTANLIPRVDAGTPVSVHDIYRHRINFPGGEPAVVLSWLSERDVPSFTAAHAKAPDVLRELTEHRRAPGLAEPIHHSTRNPMIFFTAPHRTAPHRTAPHASLTPRRERVERTVGRPGCQQARRMRTYWLLTGPS